MRRLVQGRQCAGETAADHADEGVRRRIRVPGRAAAVHLGVRQQLGVDFESDDRLVAFAGYLVASHRIDQIGPCPSLLNSVQTAAKFTILHANQLGRHSAGFIESGVVKLLVLQETCTVISRAVA